MSMGGATAHPAFMEADVKPATPEKISQKHIAVDMRTDAISDVHDAGQAGLSLEHLNDINKPLRASST